MAPVSFLKPAAYITHDATQQVTVWLAMQVLYVTNGKPTAFRAFRVKNVYLPRCMVGQDINHDTI